MLTTKSKIWIISFLCAVAAASVASWRIMRTASKHPDPPRSVLDPTTGDWLHNFYLAGDSWTPDESDIRFFSQIVSERGMRPVSEAIEGDFRLSAAALASMALAIQRIENAAGRQLSREDANRLISLIDDAIISVLTTENTQVITVALGILSESKLYERRPEIEDNIKPLAESADAFVASMANNLLVRMQEQWYNKHEHLIGKP